jgi:hypothetical protein
MDPRNFRKFAQTLHTDILNTPNLQFELSILYDSGRLEKSKAKSAISIIIFLIRIVTIKIRDYELIIGAIRCN